jgi:hypothetical protein
MVVLCWKYVFFNVGECVGFLCWGNLVSFRMLSDLLTATNFGLPEL